MFSFDLSNRSFDLNLFFFFSEMVFRRFVCTIMGCLGLSDQRTLPSPSCSETSEPLRADLSESEKKSPTVKLSDGRCLAYRELGVPKEESNYRIIMVHGFGSSKDMNFLAPQV